jgi:hypothetical protein
MRLVAMMCLLGLGAATAVAQPPTDITKFPRANRVRITGNDLAIPMWIHVMSLIQTRLQSYIARRNRRLVNGTALYLPPPRFGGTCSFMRVTRC